MTIPRVRSFSRSIDEIPAVVPDTNVFVAAGFHPSSASSRILQEIRNRSLRLVWNDETRRETRAILQKIPPLNWEGFEELFRDEDHCNSQTYPERFGYVPDPDDRKFIALSAVTGATLISSDHHLLAEREQSPVPILTPGEFLQDAGIVPSSSDVDNGT